MKLATQLLMIAATAGLAVLAAGNRPTADVKKAQPTPLRAESDAWFI